MAGRGCRHWQAAGHANGALLLSSAWLLLSLRRRRRSCTAQDVLADPIAMQVKRAKKCLDFAVTTYLLHLAAVCTYSGLPRQVGLGSRRSRAGHAVLVLACSPPRLLRPDPPGRTRSASCPAPGSLVDGVRHLPAVPAWHPPDHSSPRLPHPAREPGGLSAAAA